MPTVTDNELVLTTPTRKAAKGRFEKLLKTYSIL